MLEISKFLFLKAELEWFKSID